MKQLLHLKAAAIYFLLPGIQVIYTFQFLLLRYTNQPQH